MVEMSRVVTRFEAMKWVWYDDGECYLRFFLSG